MVALSKLPAACVWEVKITALASGSTCGHRWVDSRFDLSSVVSGCGSPPPAGTRNSPLAGFGANTIMPSEPQLAPRLRASLHKVSGVPPLTGTLRISDEVT